jgi:hypothetical protein
LFLDEPRLTRAHDVMVVVEIQKLFAGKLGAIVLDDAVRNHKAVDNVGEE